MRLVDTVIALTNSDFSTLKRSRCPRRNAELSFSIYKAKTPRYLRAQETYRYHVAYNIACKNCDTNFGHWDGDCSAYWETQEIENWSQSDWDAFSSRIYESGE